MTAPGSYLVFLIVEAVHLPLSYKYFVIEKIKLDFRFWVRGIILPLLIGVEINVAIAVAIGHAAAADSLLGIVMTAGKE